MTVESRQGKGGEPGEGASRFIVRTRALADCTSPTETAWTHLSSEVGNLRQRALLHLDSRTDVLTSEIKQFQRILAAYNPQLALARGYAIVRGSTEIGEIISIEEEKIIIKAEVKNVKQK